MQLLQTLLDVLVRRVVDYEVDEIRMCRREEVRLLTMHKSRHIWQMGVVRKIYMYRRDELRRPRKEIRGRRTYSLLPRLLTPGSRVSSRRRFVDSIDFIRFCNPRHIAVGAHPSNKHAREIAIAIPHMFQVKAQVAETPVLRDPSSARTVTPPHQEGCIYKYS